VTTTDPSPVHGRELDGDADLEQIYRRRWWTLAVLCLSLVIVFVGNSSLNVALPTLARELGATESQLQWVVAAYSLVFAGLLFTTGALGDRFGRKGALQLGLAIFVAGALTASFSDEMWQLIACRAAMGVGAAFIMPSTLSILVNVFPPHERTKAIAIWASIAGVAGAVGPLASAFVLEDFGYGAVFLVNVPFVTLAFVAGIFLVPRSKDPEQGVLDPVGALLSIVGIGSLVYGLIEAPEEGWGSPVTLVAFAVAATALLAFVLWELRVDEPMLDMRFFLNPAFSTGTGGMILVFMAMYGSMFLTTQYLQLVLGYSPVEATVRLLPMAPIMLVVSPMTPRLSTRFGANRTVAAGLALIALGFALFAQLGVESNYLFLLAGIVPSVTGVSLAMSPMTASIMGAVPPRRAGAGSAMNDATRELGAALGIAVLGSAAASQYSSSLHELTAGLPAAVADEASASLAGALQVASTLPGQAGEVLRAGAEAAFMDGFHFASYAGAVFAVLSGFLVWRYLPRQVAHEGAMRGGGESLEDVAELGLGGVLPVFPDEVFPGDDKREAEHAGHELRGPEPAQ
jgi:EmrB/QacA subfamily drug resistance transporter